MTIPRLELMSALLLSKLIVSIRAALESELELSDPVCYTDSKVSLYWIRGCEKEWKQFIENRINTIRSLVSPHYWRHCAGKDNPADIPSRGMPIVELSCSHLWRKGPDWLLDPIDSTETTHEDVANAVYTEECLQEMKRQDRNQVAHSLLVTRDCGLSCLIKCEDYSSLDRLLRVTALVLRYIRILKSRSQRSIPIEGATTLCDIDQARLCWIQESQAMLTQDVKFPSWKHQFSLFLDGSQIWRCGGRMSNSDLPLSSQNPILLDKRHHLARLVVLDAHS